MKNVLTALALAAALTALPVRAEILNGPYLQGVDTESIVVMWETASSSTGEVRYGTDVAMSLLEPSNTPQFIHEVLLTGLAPSTMYYYQVTTSEGNSDTYEFLTAPLPNEPFSMVFVGDTRTNTWDHEAVMETMTATIGYPDLVINTGDMVEDSDQTDQWNEFFGIEQEVISRGALMPVVGNHDDADSHFYFDYYFHPPDGGNGHYYSFDYGNLHVAVVDTQEDFAPGSDQYTWLNDDLSDAAGDPDIDHLHVAGHWPAYSSGAHGLADHDEWGQVRDYLQPLFEQYGVDIYWCGHDHHYERAEVNGITYIVTGGGGAPADLSDFLPEELLALLEDWGLELWDPAVLYGDLVQMIPLWEYWLPLFGIEFEGNDWKVAGRMVNHFVSVQFSGGMFTGEAWDIDGTLIDTWSYGATDPDELDDDGDGFAEDQGDCDDTDPDVHPDATEECNGIDDNCDGHVDEGCGDDDDDDTVPTDDDDTLDPADDDTDDIPGETPTNENPDDCSCDTAGRAAGGAPLLLLATLALLLRRRLAP